MITKEQIAESAEQYAEQENSAWANDYNGFVAGATFVLQNLQQCNVSGWVNCPIEPNIGDEIIVWREHHKCYAEGVYEGKQMILTGSGCHFGSYDKWLLVKPFR